MRIPPQPDSDHPVPARSEGNRVKHPEQHQTQPSSRKVQCWGKDTVDHAPSQCPWGWQGSTAQDNNPSPGNYF